MKAMSFAVGEMKIESAHVETAGGIPFLAMIIDGHPAAVIDPKLTLLDRGIVVLVDDDGYWETHTSVTLPANPEDGMPTRVKLRGATDDPAVIALARRFVNGEVATGVGMTEADFNAAAGALAAANGLSVRLARHYLSLVGDTPELADDGRVIVRDERGAEIARIHFADDD